MCQTTQIEKNISNLGKRTFEQRMNLRDKVFTESRKLANLNKGLDLLYAMLYNQFDSISQEDYKIFGNKLTLLIETLKGYINSLKKGKYNNINLEFEKLQRNYNALYEINQDIRNYRVNPSFKNEINSLLGNLPVFQN